MLDDTRHPWESEGDLPWETAGDHPWEAVGDQADGALEAWQTPEDAWRGELHAADWPEDLAGPEYWLFKRHGDGQE